MIIELLLTALYRIFELLSKPINLPSLPSSLSGLLDQVKQLLLSGVALFQNYCYWNIVVIMLGIVIAVDVGIHLYHFIMWVIKKLPFGSE